MPITTELNIKAAENMLQAAEFADHIGFRLTHHLTIQWAMADGNPNAGKRLAMVRVRASKWLKRRRVPLTCCWVLEAPRGRLHSHMMLHLPRNLAQDFEAKLPDWIGGNIPEGMIDLKPVDTPGLHKYLVKGIGPKGWDALRVLNKWRRNQGRIEGKRCGVSENINILARTRWIADLPTNYSHIQLGAA